MKYRLKERERWQIHVICYTTYLREALNISWVFFPFLRVGRDNATKYVFIFKRKVVF